MPEITMLEPYAPLLQPYRYKVLLGGRAAGRSVAISQALAYFLDKAPIKVLICRETQNSIAESSKAEFERTISSMGLDGDYIITADKITHKRTGSTVIFAGLAHNYNKIKSIPGIDIAVIEECETVSRESLDVLIPTIREHGSELIFAGNPKDRTSAVAQMFVENEPPPDSIIIRTTYLDNPFCSPETLADAEHCRKTDPVLYSHVWLGNYLDKGNTRMVPHVYTSSTCAVRTPQDICVIGVDIARDGDDDTCITVRVGKSIPFTRSYPNMDLPLLTAELQALRRRFSPDRINIDSTGHGAWAPDALRGMGIEVESVCFGESAWHPEKFHNKRTELYGLAREFFEAGGTVPADELKLQEELESSWYTLDSKNRFAMILKKDIKKRIGRSPDKSDSFCLSLYNPEGMFTRPGGAESALESQKLTISLLNAGAYGGKYF